MAEHEGEIPGNGIYDNDVSGKEEIGSDNPL